MTTASATTNEILQARGRSYGDYADNAVTVMRIKDAIRARLIGTPYNNIRPFEEDALDMIAHKIVRVLGAASVEALVQDRLDTWQDIAGYAELAVRCIKNEMAEVQAIEDGVPF